MNCIFVRKGLQTFRQSSIIFAGLMQSCFDKAQNQIAYFTTYRTLTERRDFVPE